MMSHLFNWSESAFYWEKHRKAIEQMYRPLTEAMIRLGKIQGNLKILDVAGGTGEPSLTILQSQRIQKITVTDLNFEMLKTAKQESMRRGFESLTFCACNGEELPFDSELFDRVLSRLGLMFFPNPENGLKQMLRVLRSGGRIVLAVWGRAEANPMFHVFTGILKSYIPPGPEPNDNDNPFRFAEPGTLTALANRAGAKNIQEEVFNFTIQFPITMEEYWNIRTEMSETLRKNLKTLSKEQLDSFKKEVIQAMAPYFPESQMSLPSSTVLMTCTRD